MLGARTSSSATLGAMVAKLQGKLVESNSRFALTADEDVRAPSKQPL